MKDSLYKTLNNSDIQNNDFSNLNPNNHIIGKNTLQFTTPDNILQFYVSSKSNATDNTLQPSLITSNLNATLRFTDEQDDRPILGDDSEGSNE